MLELPKGFVERMKLQLGEEADAFFHALEEPSPTSIRLHHLKGRSSFESMEEVPWSRNGYYLESRPSFHLDPHWHGGAYYVQEASSMILDDVISQLQLEEKPRTWLDMCAAPGGKTGILAKHLGTSDVLVANEVVSQRRSILRENLVKAGYLNTFITSESTSLFHNPFADIILIDAPCAGEGMMRKEPEAIHQWTSSLVQTCASMQKQIVRDAALALKTNGYLIYSTCSYSPEENIDNVAYFLQAYNLQPVQLTFPQEWNVSETRKGSSVGYQLFPHRVKGEGLFISVLKNEKEQEPGNSKIKKDKSEFEKLPDWLSSQINSSDKLLRKKNSIQNEFITVDALEKANEILALLPRAEIVGQAGELKGKDFIPSHNLAMSGNQHDHFPTIDLDLPGALTYLERNTSSLPPSSNTGWHLVAFDNTILGWAKSTTQGWKNYYPMPWRLRDRRPK